MAAPLPRVLFVLGGARSGKSRYAEERVTGLPVPWTYIATAEAYDTEMRERIADHVARRGDGWTTVEAPHDLAGAIREADAAGRPLLVDCLTLWLSNMLLADRDLAREMDGLAALLVAVRGPVALISNEVGLSIVPDNKLARRFRDAQGLLNQKVAALADEVVFVAAGLPLVLKAAH